ncbi:mortality factor 4-like protein 2 isoform X5 [Rhipicephalus microplus]|uniref:mortality factor 4-like protein 2 isoform X5 n=1 Tax=Rhipicephalus microplus TaxID=6941 RepID=UPI003F6A5BE3
MKVHVYQCSALLSRKGKKNKATKPKKEVKKERSKTPSLEKPQKQKGAAATAAAASHQPTASQASESGGESQRKKRSRLDPHVESEEAFLSRVEIKVRIPEELKPWLVDDWDLITEQKKLPCNVTVDHILADYVKQNTSVKGISSNKESAIIEVTNGLKEYFNVMLGSQLLHKFERLQYADSGLAACWLVPRWTRRVCSFCYITFTIFSSTWLGTRSCSA